MCWLTLRDDASKEYRLVAYRNLPAPWAKKLNQPLDDGMGSLVAISGEGLSIHGRPLEKFKVAALGRSAAVLPVKVQNEIVGLLVVVRKADREIDGTVQNLLQAVADFASISLVHARLFRAVEETGQAARLSEKSQNAALEALRESIRAELRASLYPLEDLISGRSGSLTTGQQQALKTIHASLGRLARSTEKTIPPETLKIA